MHKTHLDEFIESVKYDAPADDWRYADTWDDPDDEQGTPAEFKARKSGSSAGAKLGWERRRRGETTDENKANRLMRREPLLREVTDDDDLLSLVNSLYDEGHLASDEERDAVHDILSERMHRRMIRTEMANDPADGRYRARKGGPGSGPQPAGEKRTPLRYQGYVSVHPDTGEISEWGSERDSAKFPQGHKVMPRWIYQTRREAARRAAKKSLHAQVETAVLAKHPGHDDQSVHGRKGANRNVRSMVSETRRTTSGQEPAWGVNRQPSQRDALSVVAAHGAVRARMVAPNRMHIAFGAKPSDESLQAIHEKTHADTLKPYTGADAGAHVYELWWD